MQFRGGDVNSVISRYLIYSFHMPMFFGISGYLLNTDKKLKPSKYVERIIIPYVIAVLVYFVLNLDFKIGYNAVELVKSFIFGFSWYHLWYVISYLVIVFLFTAVKKIPMWIKLIGFLAIFLIAKINYDQLANNSNTVVSLIFNVIRPWNFLFFVIGNRLRDFEFTRPFVKALPLLAISMIGLRVLAFYYCENIYIETVQLLFLNVTLLFLMTAFVKSNVRIRIKSLEDIGKDSLFFYLYHVVFLIALRRFVGDSAVLMTIGALGCTAVMYGIYLLLRSNGLFKRLCLGRH
ncbi:MAG: acyltransferase family protein [Eubacterium sp.]